MRKPELGDRVRHIDAPAGWGELSWNRGENRRRDGRRRMG